MLVKVLVKSFHILVQGFNKMVKDVPHVVSTLNWKVRDRKRLSNTAVD